MLYADEWPDEAVAQVFYRKIADPTIGMLCYRFPDGALVPVGRDRNEVWSPGNEWILEEETKRPKLN